MPKGMKPPSPMRAFNGVETDALEVKPKKAFAYLNKHTQVHYQAQSI